MAAASASLAHRGKASSCTTSRSAYLLSTAIILGFCRHPVSSSSLDSAFSHLSFFSWPLLTSIYPIENRLPIQLPSLSHRHNVRLSFLFFNYGKSSYFSFHLSRPQTSGKKISCHTGPITSPDKETRSRWRAACQQRWRPTFHFQSNFKIGKKNNN